MMSPGARARRRRRSRSSSPRPRSRRGARSTTRSGGARGSSCSASRRATRRRAPRAAALPAARRGARAPRRPRQLALPALRDRAPDREGARAGGVLSRAGALVAVEAAARVRRRLGSPRCSRRAARARGQRAAAQARRQAMLWSEPARATSARSTRAPCGGLRVRREPADRCSRAAACGTTTCASSSPILLQLGRAGGGWVGSAARWGGGSMAAARAAGAGRARAPPGPRALVKDRGVSTACALTPQEVRGVYARTKFGRKNGSQHLYAQPNPFQRTLATAPPAEDIQCWAADATLWCAPHG